MRQKGHINNEDKQRVMQYAFLSNVAHKINEMTSIQVQVIPSRPDCYIDLSWNRKPFMSIPLKAQSVDNCYFVAGAVWPDPQEQKVLGDILIKSLFNTPLEARVLEM